MTAAYHEIDPSPIPEFYENAKGQLHLKATRLLLCAWTDVPELVAYFYSEAGAVYPHNPGSAQCIVRKVNPEARGKIGGTATLASYSEAIIKLFYSTEGPQWVNGVYMEEMIIPELFYIRPPGNLQWSDDTWITKEEMAFGVPVRGACWVTRVERATTYPSNPFSYIGACNAGAKACATFSNYTFSSQTALYEPPMVSSHSDYSVGTRYSYAYRIAINPFGWNKFWHAQNAAWEYLYRDGEIYFQYPVAWWSIYTAVE